MTSEGWFVFGSHPVFCIYHRLQLELHRVAKSEPCLANLYGDAESLSSWKRFRYEGGQRGARPLETFTVTVSRQIASR